MVLPNPDHEKQAASGWRTVGIRFLHTCRQRCGRFLAASWKTAREYRRLNSSIHDLDDALKLAVSDRNQRFVSLGMALHDWLAEEPGHDPVLITFSDTLHSLSSEVFAAKEDVAYRREQWAITQDDYRRLEALWSEDVAHMEDERRLMKNELHAVRRHIKRLKQDRGQQKSGFESREPGGRFLALEELESDAQSLRDRVAELNISTADLKRQQTEALRLAREAEQKSKELHQEARSQQEGLKRRYEATLVDLARETLMSPENLVDESLTDRARFGEKQVELLRQKREKLVQNRYALDPRPYRLLLLAFIVISALILQGLIF